MPLAYGTLAQRPTSGAVAGDPYIATDTHQNFIWNGSEWIITENFTQAEHDVLTHSASLLAVETPVNKFLRDDGTWAAPTATAVVEIKQTEIDFGTTPVAEKSFVITDTDVLVTSQLIGSVAYEAPTGKDLDELEMDGLDLKFAPGAGQFTLYARGLDGYIADKFKINYLIG